MNNQLNKVSKIMMLSFLAILGASPRVNAEQIKTSFFNESWLEAVVSIEQKVNGSPKPIGTGFLINTLQGHLALVTASHVIREEGTKTLKSGLRYRRTDRKRNATIQEVGLVKSGGGEWVFSKEEDIACRLIGWDDNSNLRAIPLSASLSETDLQVGAPLLILGFPVGLRSTTHKKPIARRGMVARKGPDEFTIESFVFPGNSGSPVIYVPTLKVGTGLKSPVYNKEAIVGVITEYIPYREIAISPNTNRARILFEENSGLAQMVPMSAVKKLIEGREFKSYENKLPR